jgi:hypothetical protein
MTEPSSERRVPQLFTPAGVAAVTVLASIPAKVLSERIIDPDLWWHLKTGSIITATHSIPHRDVFSYSAPGKAWTVQEWGAEVILHGIRSAFGLYGIFFWRALMLLAIYALVARLLAKRMGTGIGTWVLLGLVAYGGASNWTERPNLFSFLLFVVTLGLIERRDPQKLWWFVPIAAVWANLHGMVIIGVGLVALVGAAESLKAAFRWEGADAAWARRLWAVAGLGLVATLANPRGPGLLVHALGLVRTVSSLVTEWASPNFHDTTGVIFLTLLVVTIAALALTPRRPDPTDVALGLAFTVLALQAARNLAMAAIVLGLVAAKYLPGAMASVWTGERGVPVAKAKPSFVIGAVGLAVALGFLTAHVAREFPRSDAPRYIVDREYPVASLQALRQPGTRVFTLDFWAGYLIDQSWPNVLVYQDTRVDMYGVAQTRRYSRAIAGLPGWEETLDESCTTHVLLRPNRDPLAEQLKRSQNWTIARPPNDFAITFVRKAPASGCEKHPIPTG